jgi:hypothetical protein
VLARCDEMDAPSIRLRVKWDRQWHDGIEEMRQHLAVTDVSSDAI